MATNSKKSDEIKTGNVTIENDYLEECIGAIGAWQICVSFTASLTRYIAVVNLISIVFLTPNTDFACVKFVDNASIIAENNTCYVNCAEYAYHSSVMKTTLISDFDLICEKGWLASFTQTVLMFGVVFGGAIFGWLSDRYGRRIALISSSVLNIIIMIATPFVPNYWTFNGLRFVTGVASGGSLIVGITIMMEVVGTRYREYAGAFSLFPDGFAEAMLALYAYFLPTWNMYILGYSIACILIFILLCFVPESPRWLISQGKIDKALELIIRAAKFNKLKTEHIRDTVIKSVEKMKIKEREKITGSYADFFKDKNMSIITISTLVIWNIAGISYYGIYQFMTFLDVNIYITVVIFGLIQVPMCACEILFTKLFDRKTSLISALLLTAVTMIALIFTPEGHWFSTLIAAIGFCAVCFCYPVVYIFQTELFPTPLRNMSFGLGSVTCKIGAMAAPFIARLSPMWIPLIIFSLLSAIAAGFCILLPETKGKHLKDTIE